MSEQQEFLKELEKNEAPFETEITPEVEEKPEEKSEEELEQQAKNRRERRLMAKLQAEKESNIALSARIEALAEARKTSDSTEEEEFVKLVRPIFGDKTPEAAQATELLQKALKGAHDSAYKRALEDALDKIETERESESKAIAEEESNLDDIMDEVEENHHLDFSDENVRKGFLTLLEKASPKDKDGNIIEYADPDTVAELYLSRTKSSTNRAKEIAGRSMTPSGASQPGKAQQDATWQALKDAGIF